jgi:hypothetical protein
VRLGLQQVQEQQQVLALEQELEQERQQLEQEQRLSRLALQQLSVRLGSSS